MSLKGMYQERQLGGLFGHVRLSFNLARWVRHYLKI